MDTRRADPAIVAQEAAEQAWTADCLREYGEVLTGKYRHYCRSWNNSPIDETCPEFEACGCFDTMNGEEAA